MDQKHQYPLRVVGKCRISYCPSSTNSEFAFWQDSQLIHTHIKNRRSWICISKLSQANSLQAKMSWSDPQENKENIDMQGFSLLRWGYGYQKKFHLKWLNEGKKLNLKCKKFNSIETNKFSKLRFFYSQWYWRELLDCSLEA